MNIGNIAFFDLEATGVNPEADRIIQVGIVHGGEEWVQVVNPGQPIPASIEELTRVANAMAATAPPFRDVARQVANRLARAEAVAGFGCHNFDVPLLAAEFDRAGVNFEWPPVIDAGEIFKIHERRNLEAAMRFYVNEDLHAAHDALADAKATRQVLLGQIQRYPGLATKGVRELSILSRHGHEMADPANKVAFENGKLVYRFGAHRGRSIQDEPGYAQWMLARSFPESTKRAIRKELERIQAEATDEFLAAQV